MAMKFWGPIFLKEVHSLSLVFLSLKLDHISKYFLKGFIFKLCDTVQDLHYLLLFLDHMV